MKVGFLRLCAAALVVASVGSCAQAPSPAPSGTTELDYLGYEGRYYEIARLPTFSERNCASDVVATFLKRTDGDVSFINQCVDGNKSSVMDIGRLVLPPASTPTGEVSFRADAIGWWPWFSGTYRLLEVARDFSYVMVGDWGGSRLWILSRTRQMSDDTYRGLVARAAGRGYDTSRLVRSVQTGI